MFKYLCYLFTKLTGWTYVNSVPGDLKRYVIIGLPHTSNIDFILAMAFLKISGLNARFTIKKQWTRFPFKTFMDRLGALGVDRETIAKSGKQNMTTYMASLILSSDQFVMVVTPEGTRKPTDHWKTGFYHTARKANVPIAFGFADYKRKVFGVEKVIQPTTSEKDFKIIGDYYKDITPRHPKKFILDPRFKA